MNKINHLKHNIYISGLGVVLMGFWNVIKVFITLNVGAERFQKDAIIADIPDDEKWIFYLISYVILLVLSAIVIFIHNFVGLNAMRRAKGKKFRKSYILAAIIFFIVVFCGIPSYFTNLKDLKNIDSVIAAVIVDLTLIFILGDIIISSFKLKKIEEKKDN